MLNMIKEIEGKILEGILAEGKDPMDESIKQQIAEWKLMKKKQAVIDKMSKAISSRIEELEKSFEEVVAGVEGNKAVVDGAILEYMQKKGNTTVKYKEVVDYTLKMVNEAQKEVIEKFIQSVTKSGEIKNVLEVTDPELAKYLIDLKSAGGDDMMAKIEKQARTGFDRLPKQVAGDKKSLKEGVADNIAKIVKNLVSKFRTVFNAFFKAQSKADKAVQAFAKAVKADALKEATEEVVVVKEAVGINKGIRSIVASIKAVDMESDSDSLDAFGLREIMSALKDKWEEPGIPGSDQTSDAKMILKVSKMMEDTIKVLPKREQEA
jgi:hypothetical protein